MKTVVLWIVGIIAGLAVIGWILFGRSDRQAYRAARSNIEKRVAASQERIDAAVESATASVDLALQMVGSLPSQEAKAELLKQDIEEIGNRLKDASQARGDAAVANLDASIEAFNQTLDKIDNEAKQAENPEIKAALDRIYGVLVGAKEALVQGILKNQK